MQKILLVKTSSLGDVVHNLPVVSDIAAAFPGCAVDWVVEDAFAAIPRLHPGVRRVIPVGLRRWRKDWLAEATRREIRDAREQFREEHYDRVVDTQGLLKSALLARWARGPICGCNWDTAREKLASLFYDRRVRLDRSRHAVERNRMIAAQCLGYEISAPARYGISAPRRELSWLPWRRYAVLLHATSRADKLWPEQDWVTLGERLLRGGLGLVLPWGGEAERARSDRIAGRLPGAVIPPRLGLEDVAALLGGATAVAGVDTGLSHLAAALSVPIVGIYCATDPASTGVHGPTAVNLGGTGRPPGPDEVAAALARNGIAL
ncbi:MAG TPA: lipopolysaccharide heptosyltransferase I [Burkholderiales bacterium]